MAIKAGLALPAVAIFAASLSVSTISTHTASAAACLTAPKGAAPEGSHWYYRIERPSGRKCWRLVQKDEGKSAAARKTAQPDTDDDDEAPTGSVANAAPERVVPDTTTEQVKPAPAPVIKTLVTRNVSNTELAAQAWPSTEPSANAAPVTESSPAPAAQPPATRDEAAPAADVLQPVPAIQKTVTASSADEAPALRLLLGAIAFVGLLACAIFFLIEGMRRRGDVVISMRPDPESPSLAPQLEPVLATDAPTFAPLPPMAMVPRHDDVEDALRRLREIAKRRAA